jgi:hypothetical protein
MTRLKDSLVQNVALLTSKYSEKDLIWIGVKSTIPSFWTN